MDVSDLHVLINMESVCHGGGSGFCLNFNITSSQLEVRKRNLSQFLSLYSDVYPRYAPFVTWENYRDFQAIVNRLFYHMPLFIGMPQAILNLIVLLTIVLITRHPLLG